jgi:predicted nucleic acid-binding protein
VIYLDSCILIYAVEEDSARAEAVRQRLANLADEVAAITPLVMLECLVGPLRADDLAMADHYRRAFDQFPMLEIGAPAYLRAAEIRARQGLRTPDAIHLAVAQITGCSALWTNDSRLAAASHGLAIDVIGTP